MMFSAIMRMMLIILSLVIHGTQQHLWPAVCPRLLQLCQIVISSILRHKKGGKNSFSMYLQNQSHPPGWIQHTLPLVWMEITIHPLLAATTATAYCQYCKYKWTHKLSKIQQAKNKGMVNNRTAIHRCLQCNVNLCMDCMNDWHGYGFERINQLYNEDDNLNF